MVVGISRIVLLIHSSFSLKDKRSVLRHIKDRTVNKFRVSIAEVEDHELHNRAVLGIATVGNDRRNVNSTLDRVIQFIEELHVAEVLATDIELISY